MSKKKMTLEDLAIMVQQGFEDTASKADVERLEQRLDRIENILLAGHDRRIEKLEDTVRQLMTAVKLK